MVEESGVETKVLEQSRALLDLPNMNDMLFQII